MQNHRLRPTPLLAIAEYLDLSVAIWKVSPRSLILFIGNRLAGTYTYCDSVSCWICRGDDIKNYLSEN